MRRSVAYPLAALVAVGPLVMAAPPASAHGYVSWPPSRQALCAEGTRVADCGPIQWEPQSVEGPKGLSSCDGGLSQFSVLSDESRDWPAEEVGTTVTFSWVLTARHATQDWEYYVGDTLVASFAEPDAREGTPVTHTVDLSGFPGRQTVLAVWNIGDTPMAFYNCIDLVVGGTSGGGEAPPPTTAEPTTTAPTSSAPSPTSPEPATTTPTAPDPSPTMTDPSAVPPTTPPAATRPPAPSPPTPTAPAPTAGAAPAWAPMVAYQVGDEVTYDGRTFVCRIAHTSLLSWEPSIYTLALWLPQ